MKLLSLGLIQDVEKARELNGVLKVSMQDAQVDLLSVGNATFDKAKAQAMP